ncbi:hypothetical protein OHB56_18865 [Streptomyces sp. NBC_01635]|uniref:hypothetical protein n=1 Tax=Streptomyces sp. NBC_01635 TaxID=2975904 RepID=UPI003862F01B|nr:hypothetical protein OHB56_18865 [Streptomyces sp. NBC_01635]
MRTPRFVEYAEVVPVVRAFCPYGSTTREGSGPGAPETAHPGPWGGAPAGPAATGGEIRVKHRDGDIALLVIRTKPTAMPGVGFVTADMAVRPAGGPRAGRRAVQDA